MKPPGQATDNRAFFLLVKMASALAFGFAGAVLAAMRETRTGIDFTVTAWSGIAFFVGALIAWFYWNLVIRLAFSRSEQATAGGLKQARRRFVVFSIVLLLLGLGGWLYPLRFVPRESFAEIGQGLALAFLFLGVVGLLLWRVKRALEQDAKID